MLFLRFSFILLLFGSLTMVKAQNRWSLQKCVTYATENSLAIKQSIAQIRNAELTLKQNQLSRLPNLNAGVSGVINLVEPLTLPQTALLWRVLVLTVTP